MQDKTHVKATFFVPVLVLTALFTLVGCRPPDNAGRSGQTETNSAVQVRLELAGEPAVGPAEVRVYVLEANAAAQNAEITVTGTMTHAGMEPVISEAAATENGLYQTQDFAFDMAGDWLLQAEVTLADGSKAEDELAVTVPGS